jgi:hypothetical protein
MGKDITEHRMREFIGRSLQGRFGAETGNVIFDSALELQTATTKAMAEIEIAVQASFEQIVNYGKRIQEDIQTREDEKEARKDVEGKFA